MVWSVSTQFMKKLVDCFNGSVSRDITAEMACNAFLVEAYELEVTKHGGLDAYKIDAYKIEEYKAVCREFLCHDDEFDV